MIKTPADFITLFATYLKIMGFNEQRAYDMAKILSRDPMAAVEIVAENDEMLKDCNPTDIGILVGILYASCDQAQLIQELETYLETAIGATEGVDYSISGQLH